LKSGAPGAISTDLLALSARLGLTEILRFQASVFVS
jgi:hypothetical protein